MKLIVAVDKNWGIGRQGGLLVQIPEDMKFFREETTGKVVIMGRRTLESFPGGRPLGNRTNIVLSRREDFDGQGAIVAHSLAQLNKLLEEYPTEDIFVIGGGEVYRELLPQCDTAYITRIDYAYQADTYFPNLDQDSQWEMVGESEEETYFDLEYTFCQYRKKS